MTQISPTQFWDAYYAGSLSKLERDPSTRLLRGIVADRSQSTVLPDFVEFELHADILAQYDYSDFRFTLPVQSDIAHALITVLDSPAMREDTIPNRAQLELVSTLCDCSKQTPGDYWQRQYGLKNTLEQRCLTTSQAIEALTAGVPDDAAYARYKSTHDSASLGTDRQVLVKALALLPTDPEISAALLRVFQNVYEHLGTLTSAIWALGRHNDKSTIAPLVDAIGKAPYRMCMPAIERALQALCSGRTLFSLAHFQQYWPEVSAALPTDGAQWSLWDAGSVIWEKRLRRALEWKAEWSPLLGVLRDDEVEQVRRHACLPALLAAAKIDFTRHMEAGTAEFRLAAEDSKYSLSTAFDYFQHIDNSLQTLRFRLRTILRDSHLGQEVDPAPVPLHQQLNAPEEAACQRILYLFPFYITELRRSHWGVIQYGWQRSFCVAVHQMHPTWWKFSADATDAAVWLTDFANETKEAEGQVSTLLGYVVAEMYNKVVAAIDNREVKRLLGSFKTPEPRDKTDPLPKHFRADAEQQLNHAFVFDIADRPQVEKELPATHGIATLRHGLRIPVGIGFTLPTLPALLHDDLWRKLLKTAERVLEPKNIRTALRDYGVELFSSLYAETRPLDERVITGKGAKTDA